MKKRYHQLAKISLVCVYLIIVAGSVVRMTGSGMGCPDWPKCFGYYIPPTSADAIVFKANHDYKKGQVIQIDDVFHYAKNDFKSNNALEINNWKKNTTHNYNTFNVTHTWIEFINRLFTALAGIPILLLFLVSFFIFKKEKLLFLISGLVILFMGFEAWLGKTVVDSNLLPTKISIHLAVAFLIVAILIIGIFKSKNYKILEIKPNSLFKKILVFAFILTLIQIIFGVQVRQFVDEKMALVGYQHNLWLENPELNFYIHRTFSVAVLIANMWLFFQNKNKGYNLSLFNAVTVIIFLEILTGIVMTYFDFPFVSQPLHLVLSAILFGLQFFIILRVFFTKNIKTL